MMVIGSFLPFSRTPIHEAMGNPRRFRAFLSPCPQWHERVFPQQSQVNKCNAREIRVRADQLGIPVPTASYPLLQPRHLPISV